MDIETVKAIWAAAKSGQLRELLELIGEDRARLHAETPFGTPLHVAATRGDVAMVTALLDLGADINARGGTFGGSALKLAASNGRIEVVALLLKRGAEMDVSEPERNPLFAAIYGHHVEIARVLVDAGIDVWVSYTGQDMQETGAIEFARERGASEIVALLEELKRPH